MPPDSGLLQLKPLSLMLEGLLPWEKMSLKHNRPIRIAGK